MRTIETLVTDVLIERSQAFLGVGAPLGATQVQARVAETVAAPSAAAYGVILEELDPRAADLAGRLKDVVRPPEPAILPWAFHVRALPPVPDARALLRRCPP